MLSTGCWIDDEQTWTYPQPENLPGVTPATTLIRPYGHIFVIADLSLHDLSQENFSWVPTNIYMNNLWLTNDLGYIEGRKNQNITRHIRTSVTLNICVCRSYHRMIQGWPRDAESGRIECLKPGILPCSMGIEVKCHNKSWTSSMFDLLIYCGRWLWK